MKFTVLASGSKGNMTYIEAGNHKILIDAGISLVNAKKRREDIDFSKIDKVFITHEHSDHIKFIDTVLKKTNADLYIHGHSAGGTNPSLVEAMFFGKPILAFDVVYNRATTFHRAYYFNSAKKLEELLLSGEKDGQHVLQIAKEHYTWQKRRLPASQAFRVT